MRQAYMLLVLLSNSFGAVASQLPYITFHPQNQIVAPGSNATLSLESTNATAYQWRLNGTNILWGTNATLVVTNAQSTDTGYYMAVAKNDTGWTPSRLAYLSVVGNPVGFVPFANTNNALAQARYAIWCRDDFAPITNATAQLMAGPVLDWMQPVGSPISVTNGYYSSSGRSVPTVSPGQPLYYRVDITYACTNWTIHTVNQPSTTLQIIAGGDGYSTPSVDALSFPGYIEWPNPVDIYGVLYIHAFQLTEVTRVPGETVSMEAGIYAPSLQPAVQWRKDGSEITGATNRLLRITNLTTSDSGVYDALVSLHFTFILSPKVYFSVQIQNGEGVFRFPRSTGSSFIADFEGAPGRYYAIDWSTNLTDWSYLLTPNNVTGTTIFTNAISGNARRYYRAMLLPFVRLDATLAPEF